ncbi:hypothetical protein DIPPA_31333 [Diplonema papillatum]|nr:hypothetical protein DIPPA_31333 [Diplonema papillatum]
MAATMKDMTAALEAIDSWTRRKAHGNDRNRKIQEFWTCVREFDWDRKAKGQGCDAQLSVTVGVGELAPGEDSDTPAVQILKFVDTTVKSLDNSRDPPGDRFEKGDVTTPTSARWNPDTSKYALPAPVTEGDCHSIDNLAPKAKPAVTDPVATGDSVLTIRAEGKTLISNSGRASVPVAYQFLTTPKLVVTNPTDSRVSVTDFAMEYKDGKTGNWTKFVPEGDARPTVIGYPSYGGNVHKDEDASSFEVDKHTSCEVHFTGRQALPGVVPYHGGDLRDRIHHRFLESSHNIDTGLVECRVTLRDEAGKTMQVSVCFMVASLLVCIKKCRIAACRAKSNVL